MSICAPGIGDEVSCMPLNEILECVRYYNNTVPTNRQITVSFNREIMQPKRYKKYLLDELNSRLNCSSEKCVTDKLIKADLIKNLQLVIKLKKNTYKPNGPEGKFTWLNTLNINDVMHQYYLKEHGKQYIDTIPMDFASLPHTSYIYNGNYQDYLDRNIYKLGIVFNLDNHDQGGSHWVALYINLQKGQIYYFDSVAEPPEQRVKDLMNKIARFIKSKGNKPDMDYNKIVHQRKNTECGVYSIYFLLRMSIDHDFNEHCAKVTTDDDVNKIRDILFIKNGRQD